MAVFGLPDEVAIVFLLLPGFVLFRLFLYQGRIGKEHDEFEKTYWSVIASVVAILLFSLGYVVVTGVNPITEVLSASYGTTIGNEAVGAYLLVVLVAIVLGVGGGTVYHRYLNRRFGLTKTREGTWEFLNAQASRPMMVHVVTNDGEEVLGMVKHLGDEKRLLLRYPKRAMEDGTYRPFGEYVYVDEDEIAQLYLLTGLKHQRPPPTAGAIPLAIVDHQRDDDGAGVSGVVRNESDGVVRYVEVCVKFYDGDDTLLETGFDSVRDVAGGERWRFDVPYRGDDSDRVHRYTPFVSDCWQSPDEPEAIDRWWGRRLVDRIRRTEKPRSESPGSRRSRFQEQGDSSDE